jgi:protein SCO1/2
MTPTEPRKTSSDFLWLIPGLILGGLLWFLYQQWQAPVAPATPTIEHGTWLTPAQVIPDYALLDHRGEAFTPARLEGHWTFMFFGFTHCPDVCPTTMALLDRVTRQVREAGLPVPRVVFVSVDPVRDTVEQLSQYVPYFNEDFIGVTGSMVEINRLTRNLGIVYAYDEPEEPGGAYEVDHSAAILLFNPSGHYTAMFGAPHSAAGLAGDYSRILQHFEAHR